MDTSEKHRIVINEDGSTEFVYSDELAVLAAQGVVKRASHVEPASQYFGCRCTTQPLGNDACPACGWRRSAAYTGWVADMTPVHGPVLRGGRGQYGYATRQEALEAERAWLRTERGL